MSVAHAQSAATYTNFVRQIQYPTKISYDLTGIDANGNSLSPLAIDPGGARFELWTVSSAGPTSYLLASTYVSAYTPVATVVIRTEDNTSSTPRTRADRPFWVDVTVEGLLSGADDPPASKSVKFLHHVQSYGVDGTGLGINRENATLLTQSSITTMEPQTLSYTINSVPGSDRAKIRGEERFSAFSLEDYGVPESQIAAQTVQIWPVADGVITGISNGENIRYQLPQITLTLNDLYPSSTTYLQAYRGGAALGTVGRIVPGSALVINESVPEDRVIVLDDYAEVFDSDGTWTLELVTATPFGVDRLGYITFNLDRTMKVNGTFVTIE
jgi:hypothetical protein